ncbi:MAG: hypothetical protein RR922_01305 [Clostridia bacterium]
MKIIYMNALKRKLKINDELLEIIYELLEKLRIFGYVSNSKEMDLVDKLYKNIDKIVIGTDAKEDLKSGYYDAHKKELYLRDITDKNAVYQRLIYAMTTREIDKDKYMVGFSYTSAQKGSFKYRYEGYALNRAVVATLSNKLCESKNDEMSLKVMYKTYKTNFLGYDIIAESDNYFLESNLLNQLCFALSEDKNNIYKMLFDRTPLINMDKMFKRSEFESKEFISVLDSLSKKYFNYNKILSYVNELNSNFSKQQRLTGKTDKDKKALIKEEKRLNNLIKDTITKYSDVKDVDQDSVNSNEFLEKCETDIVDYIIKLQNILTDYIADDTVDIEPYAFASKLKQFNDIVIVKSNKISNLLFETITTKILKNPEITSVNLIEKIKYSLVNELMSTDKFKDVYNDFSFKKILDKSDDSAAYIIVQSNGHFVETVKVSDLQKSMRTLQNNTRVILTDNFKHILNSDYMNENLSKVERVYTKLKEKYSYFNKLKMEEVNFFEEDNKMYLLMQYKGALYVSLVKEDLGVTDIQMVDVSEEYSIFTQTVGKKISLLPVLYKEKGGIFSLFAKFKAVFSN